MGPPRPPGRPGSPVNDLGIDFDVILGAIFHLKYHQKSMHKLKPQNKEKTTKSDTKNMRLVLDLLGHAPVRRFVAQTRSTR